MDKPTKLCGRQFSGFRCQLVYGHAGEHIAEGQEYGSSVRYSVYWDNSPFGCRCSLSYIIGGITSLTIFCERTYGHDGPHKGYDGTNCLVEWTM